MLAGGAICVIRNCIHLIVAYSSFRIRNLKKEYKGKPEKVEALQGKENSFKLF